MNNTSLHVKDDGKIYLQDGQQLIEISNQDVAIKLIAKEYHVNLIDIIPKSPGIYPIPDLRWEDYVKIGRKVINNFTGNYEIIQQKVAVISLPESPPEKLVEETFDPIINVTKMGGHYQFRSLAIFHINELEQKIKELEKENDELAKQVESYKSYCERNGLIGL